MLRPSIKKLLMATSLIMFLHLPISPQALAQTGLNATTAPRLDPNTACTDNEIYIPDIEIKSLDDPRLNEALTVINAVYYYYRDHTGNNSVEYAAKGLTNIAYVLASVREFYALPQNQGRKFTLQFSCIDYFPGQMPLVSDPPTDPNPRRAFALGAMPATESDPGDGSPPGTQAMMGPNLYYYMLAHQAKSSSGGTQAGGQGSAPTPPAPTNPGGPTSIIPSCINLSDEWFLEAEISDCHYGGSLNWRCNSTISIGLGWGLYCPPPGDPHSPSGYAGLNIHFSW